MSESFAQLFEESLQRTEMRPGEVITAEVVRVEHSFVVVNAGLKSEAYIPIEEFKNDQGEVEVEPGAFVPVAIGSIENGYGDTILSRDTAKRLASWLALEQALESGDFVTGTTAGKVKGGLTVLVNGIRAFLPGSLVDTRPTKDLTPYENKTLEFKVIKLDRKLGDAAHRIINAQLFRVDEMLALYAAIQAPTLMVDASDDSLAGWWGGRFTRAEFHQRLNAVANVRREVIQDAGHMLHHDQPQALAALVEAFLS